MTNNGKVLNLPNIISTIRIIASPLLLIAVFLNKPDLFVWLFFGCLISDMLDGMIAKLSKKSTDLGSFLDSIADMSMFIFAIAGLFVFRTGFMNGHLRSLFCILVLFLLFILAGLWRYGSIVVFHTYLSKAATVFGGVFILSMFIFGGLEWFYLVTVAVICLAFSEALFIIFILPHRKSNVKGLWWVLKDLRSHK